MSIGQRIMECLHRKNMSQNELADVLQIHRATVNKWVLDKVVMPVKTVVRLSDLFGVTTDWLLKGTKATPASTCNECIKKDVQIKCIEDSLFRAESKIDSLNREVGALKKQSLTIKTNGQAHQKTRNETQ